jgi:TetR/AcrR family transcriptional regulator
MTTKRPDKREEDRLRTRAAILDATEAVMREEGYAAVTSRRVAERAGLKSQLVHYHFGSMDELFQELFRRNDNLHLAVHLSAATSQRPIEAIWRIANEEAGMDTVSEFVSAARHRKVLKDDLAKTRQRFRMIHAAAIDSYFKNANVVDPEISPTALSFLLSSVTTMLIEERSLGLSEGHDEVMDFIERLIGKLQGAPSGVATTARRTSKRRPNELGRQPRSIRAHRVPRGDVAPDE